MCCCRRAHLRPIWPGPDRPSLTQLGPSAKQAERRPSAACRDRRKLSGEALHMGFGMRGAGWGGPARRTPFESGGAQGSSAGPALRRRKMASAWATGGAEPARPMAGQQDRGNAAGGTQASAGTPAEPNSAFARQDENPRPRRRGAKRSCTVAPRLLSVPPERPPRRKKALGMLTLLRQCPPLSAPARGFCAAFAHLQLSLPTRPRLPSSDRGWKCLPLPIPGRENLRLAWELRVLRTLPVAQLFFFPA